MMVHWFIVESTSLSASSHITGACQAAWAESCCEGTSDLTGICSGPSSVDRAVSFSSGEIMKLQIVLESSEEGGFTASVPSLPGCVSEGDTRDEALRNIREAIELYLEPVDDDLAGKEGAEVAELVV
jgi:predicted RNase H-like HicB family nuclease